MWVGQREIICTFNSSSSPLPNSDEAEDRREKNTHTDKQHLTPSLSLEFENGWTIWADQFMRELQGKNGMAWEAGELMKLKEKQEHQYIHSEGGREVKTRKIKRIDNHQ